jgi:RNA polymerase sigma factor (TIGR02999 family)
MAEPPSGERRSDVSQLLQAWGRGDAGARDRLIPLVYDELYRIARRQMRRERSDHTLQASALVNEAYLRLVDQEGRGWQHRSQFFAIAARIMRRVLVDHARRRRYKKRGDGAIRVVLDDIDIVCEGRGEKLMALDAALQKLETHDERKCAVVELRYFGGFSNEETAKVLNLSLATVNRDWAFAKAWLRRQMTGQNLRSTRSRDHSRSLS